MFRAGLFNFSKGEIAPELYGRVDVAAYAAAVRKADNVVILKYGGLTRRMGMRVAYELREPELGWDDPDSAARLQGFEYGLDQTYALLFTHAAMHPLAFGGAVLEEDLAITAITNEANAKLTVAFHAYEVGDEIFPTTIDGALGTFLNGRAWLVTAVVDADNFRIDADTSAQAAFSGATGGTTRVGAPPAPPAPPPVPAPAVDPTPPDVYSPGGGGWGFDGWEFWSDWQGVIP